MKYNIFTITIIVIYAVGYKVKFTKAKENTNLRIKLKHSKFIISKVSFLKLQKIPPKRVMKSGSSFFLFDHMASVESTSVF